MSNRYLMEIIGAYQPGILGLIGYVSDQIGLVDTINQLLSWDGRHCKLSPGHRILAIMMSAMSGRSALWRMDEFFAGQDLAPLFGEGVVASDFNDDSLGRALDKLAEVDAAKVFSTVALKAMLAMEIPIQVLHADTTSVSVYGDYTNADQDAAFTLAYGYSKAHRPDLKQFLLGLGVSEAGIPVVANVCRGNMSDKTWNKELLERLDTLLPAEKLKKILYVADSALITGDNLEHLAQKEYTFVSRLPNTFAVEAEVKEEAWRSDVWHDVGTLALKKGAAEYRLASFHREIQGHLYRLVVVHSSQLDKRKRKSTEARLKKDWERLDKEIQELAKRRFACQADAQTAWLTFEKEHAKSLYPLKPTIQPLEEQPKRTRKGRPAKDEVPLPPTLVYQLTIDIGPIDLLQLNLLHQQASTFVLIANDQTRSDLELLQEYKGQISVEQGFSFLKEPFRLSPIFLKKPERIQSLTYILVLCLLVGRLLQHELRHALKEEEQLLVTPGGRSSDRPTTDHILDMSATISVVITRERGLFSVTLWNLHYPCVSFSRFLRFH